MSDKLSDRIRVARAVKNMTQGDLAKKAKVAPSTVYLIESDKTPKPSMITLAKIAKALDLDLAELEALR